MRNPTVDAIDGEQLLQDIKQDMEEMLQKKVEAVRVSVSCIFTNCNIVHIVNIYSLI